MRFKIESLRVMRYLKGRGFTICDVKKRKHKTLYVMNAPPKWDGQKIECWEPNKDGFLVKVSQQDKVRAIVERVMNEPTLGLKKPRSEPQAKTLPQPRLNVGQHDPLEEVFDLLNSEPIALASQSVPAGWKSLVEASPTRSGLL